MSNGRKWTAGEVAQLRKTWGLETPEAIAEVLGRTKDAVNAKAQSLGLGSSRPGVPRYRCKWTEEELQYLEDHWAYMTPGSIGKALGRGRAGVQSRAVQMGLGMRIRQVDGISANELYKTTECRDSKEALRFYRKHKLKMHYQTTHGKKRRVAWVELKTFWRWAKTHVKLLNLDVFEKGALGKEPEWMEEVRAARAGRSSRVFWTPAEMRTLLRELESQRYTVEDLAEMHHRSTKSILRQALKIGTPLRPVPSEKRARPWTEKETRELLSMARRGWHPDAIGREMGRTAAAISCRLDKIRRAEIAAAENQESVPGL